MEKATKLEEIIRAPVSSVQGRMRLQATDLWQYVIRLLLRKKLSAKLKSETHGRLRTSKPMTELLVSHARGACTTPPTMVVASSSSPQEGGEVHGKRV